MPYMEIDMDDVAGGLIWDIRPEDQGQIVEVAYCRDIKRITDLSEPVGSPDRVTYYRVLAEGD